MAEDDAQNKTEEPTSKRLEEAAKKGQIPYTRELGSILGVVAVLTVIYWAGSSIYDSLFGLFDHVLSTLAPWQYDTIPVENVYSKLYDILAIIALVMLAGFLAPILGHISQKGVQPRPEAAAPDLNKVNPIEGISKLLSMETIISFIKNFLKAMGLMFVYYIAVKPYYLEIAYSAKRPYESALSLYGSITLRFMIYAIIFMVFVVILDYYVQRFRHRQRLMMTRHEVREEHKDTEGSPEIRQRVRDIQRERARRVIDREVPKATVIVTNPTHFAVALKYERGVQAVPKVTAKGVDLLSRRIRDIAKKHGVPIVESPPLARALYREVKVGRDIPRAFYQAVAKIIATIFNMEEEKKRQRQLAQGVTVLPQTTRVS
ncbi:MAG: flagellar biosynthesis protein FlhB [Deltaproteobacteria bacterium]|nr:flagellar biosynthesis protein FlhB [Deltaproteobacteria bacterium]